MQFFKKLMGGSSSDGLKLQFDKLDQNWKVKQDGSVVYLGSKEQCEKFLNHLKGQ